MITPLATDSSNEDRCDLESNDGSTKNGSEIDDFPVDTAEAAENQILADSVKEHGGWAAVRVDELIPCRVLEDETHSSDSEHSDDPSTKTGSVPRRPLTPFTCPICLSENQVYPARHAEDQSDSVKAPDEEAEVNNREKRCQCTEKRIPATHTKQNVYENEHGVRVFELTTCAHKFCAPCLHAYVSSKLMEGTIQIPCCHFGMPTQETEEFHACDIHIHESDILQIIDMEASFGSNDSDSWCCVKSDICSGNKSDLKEKYHKVKFDNTHGKDSVRRCPKCDEPRLFDVNIMKSHDTMLQAQYRRGPSTLSNASSGTCDNAENRTIMRRMIHPFRRRRQGLSVIAEDQSIQRSTDGAREMSDSSNVGNSAPATNEAVPGDTGIDAPDHGTEPLHPSTRPIVNCHACNTEFCYFHSNAHPGETCEEYNKKALELDRVNIEYANSSLHSKQCPNCGILVSKEGGCNQIKCGNCGTHFCWLCRTPVDDGAFPEHFRWWNLNGCPNMQLDGSDEPMQCTICMAKLLSIVQLIVLSIPSLALAITSSMVCPCVVPGMGRTNRERAVNCVSFWGSFLSTLIMLPLSCLGMFILTACYCFMGTIMLFIKGCTSLFTRQRNTTHADSEETNSPELGVVAPATSPEEFLMELERIFERMEEGTAHSV